MENNPDKKEQAPAKGLPLAETGNASSPSFNEGGAQPVPEQLLPKKAETYLREAGNIEDLPQPNE